MMYQKAFANNMREKDISHTSKENVLFTIFFIAVKKSQESMAILHLFRSNRKLRFYEVNMTKYINANMLVQDIEQSRANNNHNNAITSQTHNAEHRHFIKMVLDQPAADVAPVVHGEWILDKDMYELLECIVYSCSVCGRLEGKQEPYCNCGAKMDGDNI